MFDPATEVRRLKLLEFPGEDAAGLRLEVLLDDGWASRSALELVRAGLLSASDTIAIFAQLRRHAAHRHH